MAASYTEVLMPTSRSAAVEAFGDGHGVTVFGGGTILMPEIAYGRYPAGTRTVMLERAGLDAVGGDATVTMGAMSRLSAVARSGVEPVAAAAAEVADLEVRAQATLGGNLCALPGAESPRGDLQAALLAVSARVRSSGKGGERTDSIDEFLAGADPRLVLEVEVDRPRRAAYLSHRRVHAHSYSVLSIACADIGAAIGVAAAGLGPRAVRLKAVERALAKGMAPSEAAAHAVEEVQPPDDALASSWYRGAILPTLVRRALEQL